MNDKSKRILNAIGETDDELIAEAETKKIKRIKPWIKISAAAACLILAATVAINVFFKQRSDIFLGGDYSVSELVGSKTDAYRMYVWNTVFYPERNTLLCSESSAFHYDPTAKTLTRFNYKFNHGYIWYDELTQRDGYEYFYCDSDIHISCGARLNVNGRGVWRRNTDTGEYELYISTAGESEVISILIDGDTMYYVTNTLDRVDEGLGYMYNYTHLEMKKVDMLTGKIQTLDRTETSDKSHSRYFINVYGGRLYYVHHWNEEDYSHKNEICYFDLERKKTESFAVDNYIRLNAVTFDKSGNGDIYVVFDDGSSRLYSAEGELKYSYEMNGEYYISGYQTQKNLVVDGKVLGYRTKDRAVGFYDMKTGGFEETGITVSDVERFADDTEPRYRFYCGGCLTDYGTFICVEHAEGVGENEWLSVFLYKDNVAVKLPVIRTDA